MATRRSLTVFTASLALGLVLSAAGCVDPSTLSQKKSAEPAPQADAGPPPQVEAPIAEEAAAPAAPPQPQGFAQVEWKLVDRNKALEENPALVEVENRINAADPLMAATQSYFTIGSRAHLLAFKHSIDLYKAEHEKFPPFAEFDKMMKQANVALKGLYPWQVYAYDDKTGELCILEDRAEKKRMHEERGLPAPE